MSSTLQLISDSVASSSTAMKKSNVCRCLFGKPDPETKESIRSDLKKAMDEDLGVARLRWGFDFEEDAPVCDGPYQWTELSNADEDIPAFYREDRYKSRRKVKAARGKSRRNLFPDSDSAPTLLSFSDRLSAESNTSTDLASSETNVTVKKRTISDLAEKSPSTKTDSNSSSCEALLNVGTLDRKGVTEAGSSISGASGSTKEAKRTIQSSISGYMKVKKRKASYNLVPTTSSSKGGGSSSKRPKTLR